MFVSHNSHNIVIWQKQQTSVSTASVSTLLLIATYIFESLYTQTVIYEDNTLHIRQHVNFKDFNTS